MQLPLDYSNGLCSPFVLQNVRFGLNSRNQTTGVRCVDAIVQTQGSRTRSNMLKLLIKNKLH